MYFYITLFYSKTRYKCKIMKRLNSSQIGLQEKFVPLHAQIKVISRQDFNNLSHERVVKSRLQKVTKGGSRSFTGPSEQRYKVVNTFFSKPIPITKRTGGHALKKAVFEVKPCMDLRQVRRGRKVFQIPRVLPPLKRQLFGVRRLLSVLKSKNRHNLPVSIKSSDSISRNKDKVTDKNRGTLHNFMQNEVLHVRNLSSREAVPKKLSLSQNLEIQKTSLSIDKKEPFLQKTSLISDLKGSITREAYAQLHSKQSFARARKEDNKVSLRSLSDSLSHEIKACSRSYSRSIDNKKRVYKTGSANRGSIRMAWWL